MLPDTCSVARFVAVPRVTCHAAVFVAVAAAAAAATTAAASAGLQVRVLGEGFTPDDDEDSGDAVVSNVWLYQARYRCGEAHLPNTPLTRFR